MQTGTRAAGRGGVAQAIDELDLGALGRALWRRKRLIIGLTLLAAAIAFVAVNYVTPRYKSEARVLIETRENIFLRPEAETHHRARRDRRPGGGHQPGAAHPVARSRARRHPQAQARRASRNSIRCCAARRRSAPCSALIGLVKDPMSQTPEERVLKSYMDRLVAFQVDKSRVIAIEFESEDPELAAQVVNAIADGYLVLQQTAQAGPEPRRRRSACSARSRSCARASPRPRRKVEQYRATTNLMIGTNNTTLSSQQLGDINAQLASARAQKADAESKARDHPRGVEARARRCEVLRDHQFGADAPAVRAAGDVAGAARRAVVDAARPASAHQGVARADRRSRAADPLGGRAAGAIASRTTPSSPADRLRGAQRQARPAQDRQAASTNEQDVKLRALEREAKSQRDLLES